MRHIKRMLRGLSIIAVAVGLSLFFIYGAMWLGSIGRSDIVIAILGGAVVLGIAWLLGEVEW